MTSVKIESFVCLCFSEEGMVHLKVFFYDVLIRVEKFGTRSISDCKLFSYVFMDCNRTFMILCGIFWYGGIVNSKIGIL